ncbi:cysteine dioxygenase [Sphingomonas crocodyli]|uniref:Cysteine dioxygenase n=1 Tax=Sphingomonas crocodyli TaxID=1979270 RepID=A0A437LUL2_9SPHN|nr:cysteine dioxygenase [Sphingomonas crocodyli]RVT89069.1 cysteine dioxygenase [Sphingomonas crocodyli]
MNALAPITKPTLTRLYDLIEGFDDLLSERPVESAILARGGRLLADLIATDDWLPEAYATPSKERYQQYLLYRDPRSRFSVVSFVWGPGQATPVHDHRVWGLIGVLRGAELSERFAIDGEGALRKAGDVQVLERGTVDAVSPRIGDIHRVANAYDDRTSISIHIYGADIGAVDRFTYGRSGLKNPFVSGYAPLPALIA